MTKGELRQYKYIVQEIEALEEEIESTRTKLEDPGGYLRIETTIIKGKKHGVILPHADIHYDKIASLVAEIVDLLSEIEEQHKKLSEKRKAIDNAIAKLDHREARLIKARYIEDKQWEQIAEEMNYSLRQIHRVHSDILQKMAHYVI